MLQIYTLFETETAQKPYQFGAARTYSYIAYIGESPPPSRGGLEVQILPRSTSSMNLLLACYCSSTFLE